jgi:hypothetical protein
MYLSGHKPAKDERGEIRLGALKSVSDVATLILTTLTGAVGCRRINRC